ncbi:hypothetical protein KR044_001801, partial [Drosophila immigrans]
TRSSKTVTTTTLSEYFASQEGLSNDATSSQAAQQPQNTVKDDPFEEPKQKKTRECHDTKPLPKKAPKLKSSAAGTRRGRGTGRGRGKQPSISDFLRNEQLFSEVTAQHCLADNFSPNDIEMALALSKSEAEKHGVVRLEDSADAEEEVVNLLDNKLNQSTENIRRKLQKYGFRTAAKEDYTVLAMGITPGKRNKRCRWANKFTALTLRKPEDQQKKLDKKVAALMAQQVRTKLPTAEELQCLAPFELISTRLQQLKATTCIKQEPSEAAISNPNVYYVEPLFEASKTPAHHLLKNWAAIQGRDLSPKRPSSEARRRQQQLEQVYAELEAFFGATAEEAELDELEKLVADNMVQEASSKGSTPSKEPPDKPSCSPNLTVATKQHLQSTSSTLPSQITRCTSPDLFADSDDELEMPATLGELRNFSVKVYKETTSNEINCYEIFSSDEEERTEDQEEIELPTNAASVSSVATLSQQMFETEPDKLNCFLGDHEDLVDDHNSSELRLIAVTVDSLTTLSQQMFDDEPDDVNCTLGKPEDVVISKELYAKYAHKTIMDEDEDKDKDFSLNTSQLSSFATSFNLSAARTPKSLKHNSLEQSFKTPLSRQSVSFNDKSDVSIDLTQDSAGEEEDDNGVLLSDDEINYSIWQADKTQRDLEQTASKAKRKTMPYFQTLEDLDAFLDARPSSPAVAIKSSNSHSPNKSALSKERAEFGILDAAPSQPCTLSQLPSSDTSQVHIDWTDASFLDTPPEQALKRYSSSSHKFKQLISSIPSAAANDVEDELDEFDRMVFQNAKDAKLPGLPDQVPSGLDRLLNAEINLDTLPATAPPVTPAKADTAAEQLEVNGQLYSVRVCLSPKPDYVLMPEAELLQQLYKYGIKPLKRKQAVKLLEFIYNQTHPIMLPLVEPQVQPKALARSKSTPVPSKSIKPRPALLHSASNDCLTPTEQNPTASYKFRDATGSELLRFSQTMSPALCDDFEFYVLQTNVTKKTAQPLLPLHVAWHNLLCANPSLHESVLMYEPIDLQEIYQYLKQLGHRYDPKDLKCFFDRRCIIFRYELAPSNKQVQRHVRKKPKKTSVKC